MPANLTHDRGHRERHEIRAGLHVVPDDGIDQPDARHLDEVVAGLAATVEATGDVVGQR